jgi:hypothetical protein
VAMTRFALILFVLLPQLAFTQSAVLPHEAVKDVIKRIRTSEASILNVHIPGSTISHPLLTGKSLLHKSFCNGALYLNDGTVTERCDINFDIYLNEFYLKDHSTIHMLDGNSVKAFAWRTDRGTEAFMSGREYSSQEGDTLSVFFQILNQGEISMLRRTDAVISNLEVKGRLEDFVFYHKKRFYYLKDNVISRLPRGKKMLTIFGRHEVRMRKFVDDNNFDLSKEDHIVETIRYYNATQDN